MGRKRKHGAKGSGQMDGLINRYVLVVGLKSGNAIVFQNLFSFSILIHIWKSIQFQTFNFGSPGFAIFVGAGDGHFLSDDKCR